MPRSCSCHSWIVLAALAAAGASSCPLLAHPAYVPIDPPAAFVQSDPGRTTFAFTSNDSGWSMTFARSVTEACDVVLVSTPESLFDLRLRVRVLPTLFPLRLAAELGETGLEALGALHLGPVRLVGDRRWGDDAYTRVAIYAVRPGIVTSAGVTADGALRPFIAVSWLPRATPLWSITLGLTSRGARLSIGGTW